MITLIFQEKKRHLEGMPRRYTSKVEVVNNKTLSDLLHVSKNSIKNLFDQLLREKRGFKYVLSIKIILKKRINNNEHKYSTVYFNSLI